MDPMKVDVVIEFTERDLRRVLFSRFGLCADEEARDTLIEEWAKMPLSELCKYAADYAVEYGLTAQDYLSMEDNKAITALIADKLPGVPGV